MKMSVPIVLFAVGSPLAGVEQDSRRAGIAIGSDELDALAAELGASSDSWVARSEPLLRTLAAWQRGDLTTAARWFARGMREGLEVREHTDTALALQMAVVVSIPMGEPLRWGDDPGARSTRRSSATGSGRPRRTRTSGAPTRSRPSSRSSVRTRTTRPSPEVGACRSTRP